MPYRIGVLALQGDFELHCQSIQKLGHVPILVKNASDLRQCDALIIPGGESTTMRKLLNSQNLSEPLKEFAVSHPIMGTCAGAILLSRRIEESPEPSLGFIDITIQRNAYGRQVHSFTQTGRLVGFNGNSAFEMVFIRAPIISDAGAGVEKIAYLEDQVVMVRNKNILALTFHPELTPDTRVHQYFVNKFLTNN